MMQKSCVFKLRLHEWMDIHNCMDLRWRWSCFEHYYIDSIALACSFEVHLFSDLSFKIVFHGKIKFSFMEVLNSISVRRACMVTPNSKFRTEPDHTIRLDTITASRVQFKYHSKIILLVKTCQEVVGLVVNSVNRLKHVLD